MSAWTRRPSAFSISLVCRSSYCSWWSWLDFPFFFGNLFSPLTIGKLPTYLTGLVTVRPAQIQVVKLCLCFSIFCLQVLPLNRGGGGNTAVEATAVVLLHVQSLISGLEHELGA